MAKRKGKFKTKNSSGSYDQVMLETEAGQIVDGPFKSLERNTKYVVNDVVVEATCPGAYIVCKIAGTTNATTPAGYKGAEDGAEITDGTAKFEVHNFYEMSSALVGDVAFRPYLAKKWVKANGATVNRADYPRLVKFATDNNLWTDSPSTEPWKYGRGNGSTTMVLPDYRNRFIQGGDITTVKGAGLPNIIGYFGSVNCDYQTPIATGAMVDVGEIKSKTSGAEISREKYWRGTNFDASRSNPIFGTSNTVQPPSIMLIPQIKA